LPHGPPVPEPAQCDRFSAQFGLRSRFQCGWIAARNRQYPARAGWRSAPSPGRGRRADAVVGDSRLPTTGTISFRQRPLSAGAVPLHIRYQLSTVSTADCENAVSYHRDVFAWSAAAFAEIAIEHPLL